MRENLTLSSIVQEFRTAAEAHLSVESFEAGYSKQYLVQL